MGKKSRNKQQRKPQAKVAPVQAVPTATNLGQRLSQAPTKSAVSIADYSYVRKDIKTILISLVVLTSLLITAVIINSQTSFLQSAGSRMASFLELQ